MYSYMRITVTPKIMSESYNQVPWTKTYSLREVNIIQRILKYSLTLLHFVPLKVDQMEPVQIKRDWEKCKLKMVTV